MPRNAEVIRQWVVLREIETARSGLTVDELAAQAGVTTRTIRRDLQALEAAGFPVFDDRTGDDGRTRWRLNGQAFRGLAAGLSLAELGALYFSRTLVESLAGTPFKADVESAFKKLGSVLTPHMRLFLDQLPRVIITKPEPRAATGDPSKEQEVVRRAYEAILQRRQATIVYYSRSSERTKEYAVHPYRLAHAHGALYLLAYVPEYGEVRTFAVERVASFAARDEGFDAVETIPDDVFPDSLGVHSGQPERVQLEFDRTSADYVRARQWHRSQSTEDLRNGGVRLTLEVCRDHALRSWILSFGPLVKVVAPDDLAQEIAGQLEAATANYEASAGRSATHGEPRG